MIYLNLDELLYVAERAIGSMPEVRDRGLLESALSRPKATVFGEDAYGSIHEKAAALLHSLARNHALVDGNKRLSLGATIVFYGINGIRLTLSENEAYDLIIAIATGDLDDASEIAKRLQAGTAPR